VSEALKGMVGGTIEANHLAAHWDKAIRLAVSTGSGHASTSGMLRRLSAYPRQNGLAVALREIGRIERTLFTLVMWNTARKRKSRFVKGVAYADRAGILSGYHGAQTGQRVGARHARSAREVAKRVLPKPMARGVALWAIGVTLR
jgi:hypothetical protein